MYKVVKKEKERKEEERKVRASEKSEEGVDTCIISKGHFGQSLGLVDSPGCLASLIILMLILTVIWLPFTLSLLALRVQSCAFFAPFHT